MHPTNAAELLTSVTELLIDVPCEDVMPDPDNTRKNDSPDEELPALVTSLKTVGQQMAITVYENSPKPDGRKTYTVISGHRRLMAAPLAGMVTIKAIVVRKPQTRGQRHLARLAENKARKGLSPIEDVDAVTKARRDNPEMSNKAIADFTGYSETYVSKCLAIDADPVAHAALADGRLNAIDEAYAVARAAPGLKNGMIEFRRSGGPAKAMADVGKPKRTAPTVKLDTIKLPLPGGTTVTVKGEEMDGEGLVEALNAALSAAKAANKDQIDVKTLSKVMHDKAKAAQS